MINPYYSGERFILYTGDTIEVLSELPSRCVQCVVTSPPYWGLRDYGVTGTWTGGQPHMPTLNRAGQQHPAHQKPHPQLPRLPSPPRGQPADMPPLRRRP